MRGSATGDDGTVVMPAPRRLAARREPAVRFVGVDPVSVVPIGRLARRCELVLVLMAPEAPPAPAPPPARDAAAGLIGLAPAGAPQMLQ